VKIATFFKDGNLRILLIERKLIEIKRTKNIHKHKLFICEETGEKKINARNGGPEKYENPDIH
jgi:hypothetical protein